MTEAGGWLFGAVLAQAALTAALYLLLVRARFKAANAPETDRKRVAFDQSAWPLPARLLSNSVTSQFELPVLFYVGALFAFQFGAVDFLLAAIAWIFVLLRILHAIEHTGANVVMRRFGVFLAGFIALIGFWAVLAFRAFV
jgi:hypothetical protein